MDRVCVPRAVDAPQQAARAVVGDQRPRFAVVDVQAPSNRFGAVVPASLITAADALRDNIVGHVEQHHGSQLACVRLERADERIRLSDGAREAVERVSKQAPRAGGAVLVAVYSRRVRVLRGVGSSPYDRSGMKNSDEMLAVAGARAEDLAAPGLNPRPRRKVAVVACMDTRLDLFAILGLARGDAHIIRNAGGLVTDDVMRSLSASQRLLGTEEILVVMHDGCGLLGASEADFAEALSSDGARPAWRLGAFDDIEATLRHSLAQLRSNPALPARDHIRGLIFDPESGLLREIQ